MDYKAAAGCWYALLIVACVLISYGLSPDGNSAIRNSVVELELLVAGPTPEFVQYCREFEKSRVTNSPGSEATTDWAEKAVAALTSLPVLSEELEITGMLWCPFPKKTRTVRDAVRLVNDLDSSSVTLWPNTEFLELLALEVEEQKRRIDQPPTLADQNFLTRKFSFLARSIASGNPISRIWVTSDPKAGQHTMFPCANAEAIFDDTYPGELSSPTQLIINAGGFVCLDKSNLPAQLARLVGVHGFKQMGFYQDYFKPLIKASPRYSGPADNQTVLPVLQTQLTEIGSLSIEDAIASLNNKLANGDVLELFSIKMPVSTGIGAACLLIPILASLVIVGFRKHGERILPEAVAGLPISPAFSCAAVVCVLPAIGLALTAHRIEFVFPEIWKLLLVVAGGWLIASSIAFYRSQSVATAK